MEKDDPSLCSEKKKKKCQGIKWRTQRVTKGTKHTTKVSKKKQKTKNKNKELGLNNHVPD